MSNCTYVILYTFHYRRRFEKRYYKCKHFIVSSAFTCISHKHQSMAENDEDVFYFNVFVLIYFYCGKYIGFRVFLQNLGFYNYFFYAWFK